MRLLHCELTNFGSYRHLEFDFSAPGLSLVYGATGSGKSTLQDAPAWILYGITSKNGNADEVRSWQTPYEPTKGILDVELSDGSKIRVTRIRGRASDNDLYWQYRDGHMCRGKDLSETQSLLEDLLAVSSDLYVAGSYFHEFSPSGSFFTAKAKERREVLESIANLSFPMVLLARTSSASKVHTIRARELFENSTRLSGQVSLSDIHHVRTIKSRDAWEQNQKEEKEKFQERYDRFETEKAEKIKILCSKIEAEKNKVSDIIQQTERLQELKLALNNVPKSKCEHCGANVQHVEYDKLKDEYGQLWLKHSEYSSRMSKIEQLEETISSLSSSVNPYLHIQEPKPNPFIFEVARSEKELQSLTGELDKTNAELATVKAKASSLETLQDVAAQLRGELLRRVVKDVEISTNTSLETTFDAELRVQFSIDNDKLDVEVTKNGYACTYKQLSKGQRQMLRLSFAVGIMKATANRAGVHFQSLFFDEALDGLDSALKTKAYALFERLEANHASIMVIEHAPELKEAFAKRYHVQLIGDESVIEADE